MAGIEVSGSARLTQPIVRRFCTHPFRSRSLPSLVLAKSRMATFLDGEATCETTPSKPSSDHQGRGKKSKRAMRFPVYESLYLLNRNIQDILVILEEIKNSQGMPKKSFEAYQVEIQYLRSQATQDVLEVMNDTEIHEMAKLGKHKKAYEDSIRDLDDVYFEVQRREEQRRKAGLPSLIGVLPPNYQPRVSEPGEADDAPLDSASAQDMHSRHSGESRARGRRGRKPKPTSRTP